MKTKGTEGQQSQQEQVNQQIISSAMKLIRGKAGAESQRRGDSSYYKALALKCHEKRRKAKEEISK